MCLHRLVTSRSTWCSPAEWCTTSTCPLKQSAHRCCVHMCMVQLTKAPQHSRLCTRSKASVAEVAQGGCAPLMVLSLKCTKLPASNLAPHSPLYSTTSRWL